jgi:glycosyltransferase involved in cell wall biosynthesis
MPPTPARDPGAPVRVLRLITRLNIGGPSIQAISLTDRLRAHGFDTTLVHGRLGAGEGDMSYLLPPEVEALHVPALQRALAPVDDLRALAAVYRLLCRVRPAIVHTHMAKAGAIGRAAAAVYNRTTGRGMPARTVHTYHGHVLEGYFSARKTALFIGAERRLARLTDRIVAISPQIEHDLLTTYAIGRPAQYVVVPLGFDLGPFAALGERDRREARVSLQIPFDARVVTTVGRLTAIKDHRLFLEAAAQIARRDAGAVFLIVGDGELRAELEALARTLQVSGQVRFLGWRRDLTTIYAATDVFALTSRNEGTPVALIEAMASGVPGVSTDVGGVPDVILDETMGRRVAPGDAEAMADAVAQLLDRADRPAIGQRARELVLMRFGIDRLVADTAALYRSLVGAAI